MTRPPLLLLGLMMALAAPHSHAQRWLDRVDDSLFYATPNELFRVDLTGLLDLEGYYIDQRPPGLIFVNDRFFFNPRLSLFLEAQLGNHLYASTQARIDRGFDPGVKRHGDARFDEYILRYTPWSQPWVNLQAGKFATVVGNWVPRHLSWDNPFINAPLPYENVLGMTDQTVPGGPGGFLGRRAFADRKTIWLPILWGPSYASGASVFGSAGRFDYALEVKNAALSSRPAVWDARDLGFDAPTWSGRFGFRPTASWNLGLSASGGSYLLPAAETGGVARNDSHQFTFAHDLSYAWHHWQFWAEVFFTRFQVPNVGDADTAAYYVEAKYKLSPRWFVAGRWNQQFFGTVPTGLGETAQWDHQTWRAESALGFRMTRHMQLKGQYSYTHKQAPLQQGEQFAGLQFTVKF